MQISQVDTQTQPDLQALQQPLVDEGDDRGEAARLLDQVIPLKGASHADVVSYAVEIPMRYAECFALLKDGRKVGFVDRRRFVGWSRDSETPSFLFRKNLLHIELRQKNPTRAHNGTPRQRYDVILETAIRTVRTSGRTLHEHADQDRKFIGVDGSLVTLPGRRLTSIGLESPSVSKL